MGITRRVHHLRLGGVRDDIAVSTLTTQGWKPAYRSRDTESTSDPIPGLSRSKHRCLGRWPCMVDLQ